MKIKILTLFILLFTLSISAQGHKEKRDKIKALKVSFLTTELKLTADESAKFWPIYNTSDQKQFEIRHGKIKAVLRSIDKADIDKISEKEALAYLEQIEDAEEELLNLRKKLIADLKPVIGPVRVLKLKKAEDDFNRKLLSQYKDRRKN
ncbi:sensor of ECF-type sigma factor [Flavobacterium sp. MK4S-17]|uniref:sensor of ECF-type sigma factor n=1 Tax=Flavobacterium sp. MK4S-17 TaxID=2543737 RepID=UPI001357FE55|nr:sensor of ECF-type sigma factor [Flavobacterium sp. MK4S-17]